MNIDYRGTQWSTLSSLATGEVETLADWIPEQDKARISSYLKYDEMYWNDPKQYALRVLEGENPIYIPNPRTIVDTTAHFLLKGLKLTCQNINTQNKLDDFLKRETFYSRFSDAKRAGVTRGDYVFHLTADPSKEQGSRISLNSVPATDVYPIWDENEPERMIGCNLMTPHEMAAKDDQDQSKIHIRKLTYLLVEENGSRRVSREEAIYEYQAGSFFKNGSNLKKVKTILEYGLLDPRIQALPVYWFKNKGWDGEDFGSSELRGVERIAEVISQGSTDVAGALALEGLGVYATDGGRPVIQDADGNIRETDWQIAPGKVLEIATGSKFERVKGITSITPAVDQTKYLEDKLNESLGLSDVALGKIEAQVADSGIALAIRFLPTQAKIDDRDQWGVDRLTQLFYDWKTWYSVFEFEILEGDIIPTLADKLPVNRASKMNELNNMKDRNIISSKYYRKEMESLGYVFPDNMEDEILEELRQKVEASTVPTLGGNLDEPGNIDSISLKGKKKLSQKDRAERDGTSGNTLPSYGNRSNNKNRPNESSGTEDQKLTTRDA